MTVPLHIRSGRHEEANDLARAATREATAAIRDAEAVLGAMDGPALRELLAAVARETDAETAALCLGGLRLVWSARPRSAADGSASSGSSEVRGRPLERRSCHGNCPALAGTAAGPALPSASLCAAAGPDARLCVSGARHLPSCPTIVSALAIQAAHQIVLHRRLAETAALASETDHRVRNALQSIASFLRLEEARAENPAARAALAAAFRQVRAIALLHDEIGREGDGSLVRLDRYVAKIGDHLAAVVPDEIRLEVDVAPAMLPADKAGTLAIIINEFITNSAKHAFGGGGGTVRIEGRCMPDGLMAFTLADDGLGAPGPSGHGLGLRILEAAALKLGARQEFSSAPGKGYRLALSFPVLPAMPQS